MTSAVLTTKGQITVPAEVRKEMGLSTGDRVYFIRNPETGRFEVTRKTRLVARPLRHPEARGAATHD